MATASLGDFNRNDGAATTENLAVRPQGNMVQANNVETVNFNNHPRLAPPHELPSDFVGPIDRDVELARLDSLLAEHPQRGMPIVVSGPAHVGKTTFVVRWAHRSRDSFPDGEIYLDLHGYGPGSPAAPKEVLATLLRSLGAERSDAPSLEERTARYRSLLFGRRMLVLLDNVRDTEQARLLLPGDRASFLVLISRDGLAGVTSDATRIVLSATPDTAITTSDPDTDPKTAVPPAPPSSYPYDVFVSYAAEDADWVDEFAGHLRDRGVAVARDVLLPGDRRAHTVARAILQSQHGLLVFSHASLNDNWIREEYELLLQRSVESGQRFIPVVIEDVALPPFATTRHPCDFRELSAGGYHHQIDRLARAVKPMASD